MKFYIALAIALMTTNLAQAEMTNVRDSSSGSKSVTKDSNIIEAISTAVNGLRGSRRRLSYDDYSPESGKGKSASGESPMQSAMHSVGSKSGGGKSASGDSSMTYSVGGSKSGGGKSASGESSMTYSVGGSKSGGGKSASGESSMQSATYSSGSKSGKGKSVSGDSSMQSATYSSGSKSGKGKSASGSVDEGISSSKSGKGKSGHFKGISSNGYKNTGYGHFSSKPPFAPENANATSIKIQAPLGICPSVELCGCVCLYEPQIGNDCLTTEQANMLIATADASFVCSSDGISSQDACDTFAEQVPGFLSENGLGSPQGYTCIRAWDSSITETSGPIQIFSPTGVPEV